jgi:hypothetical protein
VAYAQNTGRTLHGHTVKQACVWIFISRAITQISTSNLVVFFLHIQNVWLIK